MHLVWYLSAKLHSVFTGRPDFFHTPAPAPWVPHHVPSSGTWCGCSRVRSGWTGMVPGGPWSPPFPLALHRRCLADGGTCCAPPHGKRMKCIRYCFARLNTCNSVQIIQQQTHTVLAKDFRPPLPPLMPLHYLLRPFWTVWPGWLRLRPLCWSVLCNVLLSIIE